MKILEPAILIQTLKIQESLGDKLLPFRYHSGNHLSFLLSFWWLLCNLGPLTISRKRTISLLSEEIFTYSKSMFKFSRSNKNGALLDFLSLKSLRLATAPNKIRCCSKRIIFLFSEFLFSFAMLDNFFAFCFCLTAMNIHDLGSWIFPWKTDENETCTCTG